jgi:peroxiredoxin
VKFRHFQNFLTIQRFNVSPLLFLLLFCGCKQQPPGTALLGKPIDLQFKALDGRDVSLAAMRGKVVLIDFWATWCPPCVQEVPGIKALYEKFHSGGLEVIGISLDDKKEDLLSFVKQNKIEWPQYFDELGAENKIAKKFGIEELPTMWLIDKQGLLRDVDAAGSLSEKVQKLPTESAP